MNIFSDMPDLAHPNREMLEGLAFEEKNNAVLARALSIYGVQAARFIMFNPHASDELVRAATVQAVKDDLNAQISLASVPWHNPGVYSGLVDCWDNMNVRDALFSNDGLSGYDFLRLLEMSPYGDPKWFKKNVRKITVEDVRLFIPGERRVMFSALLRCEELPDSVVDFFVNESFDVVPIWLKTIVVVERSLKVWQVRTLFNQLLSHPSEEQIDSAYFELVMSLTEPLADAELVEWFNKVDNDNMRWRVQRFLLDGMLRHRYDGIVEELGGEEGLPESWAEEIILSILDK